MSKIMYKGRSYANAGVSSDATDATSIPTADMTAAFDSNAHMNSEDMTATEVSDFVDGVGGGTGAFADKVIEQGTSGSWGYRKWNSGVAECWARIEKTNLAYTSQRFGINAYMAETTGAFPFSLGEEPRIIATGAGFAGEYGFLAQAFSADGVNYTIRLIRQGTATTGTTAISIHAIGRWE